MQAATRGAYRVANRVWLEWIRTSKARLVFRYEISDLLSSLGQPLISLFQLTVACSVIVRAIIPKLRLNSCEYPIQMVMHT